MDGFSSAIMGIYDPQTFSPEEEFSVYDGRYEVYDPEKKYDKEPFVIDRRTYQNVLHSYTSRDGHKLRYVVAKEIISEEELKTLQPYCQCAKHQMWWFQPVKYFICPCCVGCLNAGVHYAGPWVIKKTREVVEARKGSTISNMSLLW